MNTTNVLFKDVVGPQQTISINGVAQTISEKQSVIVCGNCGKDLIELHQFVPVKYRSQVIEQTKQMNLKYCPFCGKELIYENNLTLDAEILSQVEVMNN